MRESEIRVHCSQDVEAENNCRIQLNFLEIIHVLFVISFKVIEIWFFFVFLYCCFLKIWNQMQFCIDFFCYDRKNRRNFFLKIIFFFMCWKRILSFRIDYIYISPARHVPFVRVYFFTLLVLVPLHP